MDLGLKGKIAFVAASSQGLGRSAALELAKEGAAIIICGRNKQSLDSTHAEIKALGVRVLSLVGDITNASDNQRMIDATLKEFGKVDILVTNTGGPPTGKFETLTMKDWESAVQQMLTSAVMLIKGFLPGMKERKWGRIITITSMAVKQPVNNLILSNAVRSSLVGLMKSLANEVGEFNITVNNVMPGYTRTDRLKELMDSNPSFVNVTSEIPLRRLGEPEEFAAAIAFLASERAGYITGVSLPVDGGWIRGV